jgi:hypothetical protein
MILKEINLFLFILSSLFSIKFLIEFLVRLREENPEPISVNKNEQVLLYFAISYIITFIITLI